MTWSMRVGLCVLAVGTLLLHAAPCKADPENKDTDWFKNARYGVFMHFLPGDAGSLALTDKFDGGYAHVKFNEAIARIYADAAKHGNPHAIVTFNPGIRVIHYTKAEDYTAGELNEPFGTIPSSRWLSGSQWHALTYLGSNWSHRDTRYPAEKWAAWVKAVVAHEGVVTLDMGPNWNPQAGPIGSLAQEHLSQVQAIKAALDRPSPGE